MLITSLTGYDLAQFFRSLGVEAVTLDARIHTLRFHQNSDGTIQHKVNGGTWSAPVGEMDPTSDLFARRRDEEGRYRTLTDPANA